MTLETTTWDPADHLDSDQAELAYLNAALEDGNPDLIAAAIGDIVRARGASDVARRADISREAIYKSLCTDGNPTITTVMGVMKALGFILQASPIGGEINTARM